MLGMANEYQTRIQVRFSIIPRKNGCMAHAMWSQSIGGKFPLGLVNSWNPPISGFVLVLLIPMNPTEMFRYGTMRLWDLSFFLGPVGSLKPTEVVIHMEVSIFIYFIHIHVYMYTCIYILRNRHRYRHAHICIYIYICTYLGFTNTHNEREIYIYKQVFSNTHRYIT